jgi:GT2 family glycosyltransferase
VQCEIKVFKNKAEKGIEGMKKIGIVILNYKNKKDSFECIDSFNNINYPNFQIIFVDNNSEDDIQGLIEKNYQKVTFIQSGFNGGYASGNNLGIKEALQIGCDYVLVINNDTIVERSFLSTLVEYAEQNNIEIVSPKILCENDRKTIWAFGGKINYIKGIGNNNAIGEIDSKIHTGIVDSTFLSGCCFLVRSDVFEKIGLIPEEYFLYFEDAEFCMKAHKQGYKMRVISNSVIYHKESATVQKSSPLLVYYFTRNRLVFVIKNFSLLQKVLCFPYLSSTIIVKLIKFRVTNKKLYIALKQGIKDAFKNKLGINISIHNL